MTIRSHFPNTSRFRDGRCAKVPYPDTRDAVIRDRSQIFGTNSSNHRHATTANRTHRQRHRPGIDTRGAPHAIPLAESRASPAGPGLCAGLARGRTSTMRISIKGHPGRTAGHRGVGWRWRNASPSARYPPSQTARRARQTTHAGRRRHALRTDGYGSRVRKWDAPVAKPLHSHPLQSERDTEIPKDFNGLERGMFFALLPLRLNGGCLWTKCENSAPREVGAASAQSPATSRAHSFWARLSC